jgi:hypothetical protein
MLLKCCLPTAHRPQPLNITSPVSLSTKLGLVNNLAPGEGISTSLVCWTLVVAGSFGEQFTISLRRTFPQATVHAGRTAKRAGVIGCPGPEYGFLLEREVGHPLRTVLELHHELAACARPALAGLPLVGVPASAFGVGEPAGACGYRLLDAVLWGAGVVFAARERL